MPGFNDPHIVLIINSGRRPFSSKKQNHLPITKDTLEKITEDEPLLVVDLNFDTTFKMVYVDFMKMGELMYTTTEANKATFPETGLTRSDISFAKGD